MVVMLVLLVELGVDVWKRRLVLSILYLRSSKLIRVPVGLHRVWVKCLLEHLRTLHTIVTHVDLSRHVVLILGLLVTTWDVKALLLHARCPLVREWGKVERRVERVWRASAASRRVGDERWCTFVGELRVGRWRWKRSLEAAVHWSGLEVRNHDAWWDVSLLLVDGWERLLVVGALRHSLAGVVHVLWHSTVLGDHLVAGTHWTLRARLHLGAALLVASSAVLSAVPPVLDGIVAATTQSTGNLSPALTHLSNHLLDQSTLFGSDGVVVEVWLEVLVVAFSALLWRASLDHGRDANPVVSTLGVDETEKDLVLGLGPWTSLVSRHCECEVEKGV